MKEGKTNNQKFYITTAIPYMNTKLHLGFFYEAILADVMARFNRLLGKDVFFLTGADEHGQKIYKSAQTKGVTPQDYVDKMVEDMKRLLRLYDISNDSYIRTTSQTHQRVVQDVLNKLYQNGDLYKGKYEGWYCVTCESFLMESQLEEGKCPECKGEVEKLEEENYFFKLSKYENRIREHISKNPDFVIPQSRKNEVLGMLDLGLRDISISRTTVNWAVSVPFDEKHYCYVWVDALINYISALGYSLGDSNLFKKYWPCDQHHIGKDILKFHAIIWPALLMSLGLELPRHVVVHGWVMLGKEKLSKSRGITLDPDKLSQRYGVDAVRYFVTREISFGHDGSFTHEAMTKRYNADLSNDIGNLVSRTVAMVQKYREGLVPKKTSDNKFFKQKWDEVKKETVEHLNNYRYSEYLIKLWEFINVANKYIEDSQPWSLAKSKKEEDIRKLDSILYELIEAIRLTSIMLSPFMPSASEKIFKQIGLNIEVENLNLEKDGIWGAFEGEKKVGKREILFPRI